MCLTALRSAIIIKGRECDFIMSNEDKIFELGSDEKNDTVKLLKTAQ